MLLALLSACNRVNQLDSPDRQQVVDWADKRKTDLLIEVLQDDDESLAAFAAMKLASVQDETALPYLLQTAENEQKLTELRKAALFALGLSDPEGKAADQLALLIPKMEKEQSLMEALIVALGRSNKYFEDFIEESISLAGNEKAVAMASVYHGVNYRVNAKLREVLIKILKSTDEEARMYAAAALARSYLNEENCSSITPHISTEKSPSVRYFLMTACKSCKESEALQKAVLSQAAKGNLLDQLGALRALRNFDNKASMQFISETIQSSGFAAQEAAANLLLQFNSDAAKGTAGKILRSDPKLYFGAQALLYETILQGAANQQADSISGIMAEKIQNSSNVYEQMALIRALGAHYTNLTWLQTEAFGTESILVRLAAIEGIIKIRRLKDFQNLNREWLQNAPRSKSLFKLCSETFQQALETYDVSLCAELAQLLMDTSLVKDPEIAGKSYAISLTDTSVFTRALRKMKLPRDTETYNLLAQARLFYKGKGQFTPYQIPYNNPIDWELVNRIPQHQEVKFSTTKGDFQLRLFVNEAPATAGFFLNLIKEGYYIGKFFHRVVPGFVIQGGCPRGDGYGGLMQTLRTEISEKRFQKEGMLGMASAGKDTESSQFFVTLAPAPHLDGRYTIFGEVSKGIDVVKQISVGDRITETEIMP